MTITPVLLAMSLSLCACERGTHEHADGERVSFLASADSASVADAFAQPPLAALDTVSTSLAGGGVARWVAPRAPRATEGLAWPDSVRGSRTILVRRGESLQGALDRARSGDEVVLANGATFTGNFVLPVKSGSGWIVVRAESGIPAAGTRATAALLANAPKVVSPNADPAIRTAAGAARYRLVGFEVVQGSTGINYGLVVLGRGDETALNQLPSHIVLDRMYIHGNTTADLKRCVAFNGAHLAVIDSYLAECHGKGFDAQGVGGWGGPGPYHIENNRIEGSGQAIMFGGADPKIANVSPSDITIKRNYLYKPMSWAGRWSIKATFELKHGKRVLFEGNVLENHWADAQTGFAILFQTLSDNNSAWAWTTVQDVLVRDNLIKTSTSGVNMLSRVAYDGGTTPTNPTSRVAIVNNLFQQVGKDPVSGNKGMIFQLLSDLQDVTVANNTAVLAGSQVSHAVVFDGAPQTRLTLANNVFPASDYGVFGSGKGMGTAALTHYAPGSVFKGNVLPAQSSGSYPADNFFPSSSGGISFTGDYSLSTTNAFYSGVFGNIGISSSNLTTALSGVTGGALFRMASRIAH